VISHEFAISPALNGRSVFDEKPQNDKRTERNRLQSPKQLELFNE
jgi:hypothetical protein